MNPSILIISGNINNCIKINDYFISYAKYIDYETNITELEDKYYEKYDIIIYDLDFMDKIILPLNKNALKPIIIVITNNTDNDAINNLMNSGIDIDIDIVIPYLLDDKSVIHCMSIYKLIVKHNQPQSITY